MVRAVFEDAHNYMKSGQLLRQVINRINEVDFNNLAGQQHRRIAGGALAAAVIASGVFVAVAPSASAKRRQCGSFTDATASWWDQYVYDYDNYGFNDSRADYAVQHYVAAIRQANAGC